ncbi:dihydroorotate dehydrogenase [Micromonospora sp. NBC_01655]|uniref:dihydroorotate dehydrogenase n=1 Tax=Micromonospora sp. NBC_01655 TaxID=2975983 RepID=UPI002251337F|nr:dihydroorotate dehydrogenase [Micromonospora sp. NBC_01655]MCX4472509.1 dihydroorotate dehydrogenase [Micromonospora sp. NBC_01655]
MLCASSGTMGEAAVAPTAEADSRDHFWATSDPVAVDLSVTMGDIRLNNPVMPASGCFGPELGALLPVHELGALVTKTVFATVRSGNPAHRITEAADGMLNSVGIPSPGIAEFRAQVLPRYLATSVPTIISIGGLTVAEYWAAADQLAGHGATAVEVNVSCPNLEHGGLAIGTDPSTVERVVSGVVARSDVPVFVKLTPNVTSIAEIARAAEHAGATAITVANTFPAMSVDVTHRSAVLGNGVGGLSGPAVKPIALRLVWQAAQAVNIPVIGCGGITTARDALEFLLAGATAIQVGTANFTRPYAMAQIVRGLGPLLAASGTMTVSDVIGSLRV